MPQSEDKSIEVLFKPREIVFGRYLFLKRKRFYKHAMELANRGAKSESSPEKMLSPSNTQTRSK